MFRLALQRLAFLSLMLFSGLSTSVLADQGEGPLVKSTPSGITPQEIITRFAAKEKQFAQARERYTYRESVKIQTLDGDTVDGEYQQTWDINFDNQGRRFMSVTYAPQPTLIRVGMTKEDLNDIQNLMPFVLTTDEIPDYEIDYVGRQRQDQLDTYVFDIAPKHIDRNRRYFEGRIWVDDRDFQIVKTYGKSVPDIRKSNEENLFPRFTTYRQQVDNVYWFPTYTRADDDLHFSSGDVHIRIVIQYSDYKRFGSEAKIIYDGKTIPTAPPSTPQPQSPPQP
jgi:hypothetical protein